MFLASSAHLQEDIVVYKQHMVPSLSKESWWPVDNAASCVSTGHQEFLQRVTVPYAACIQLCPPEDEHLMQETCREE